MLDSSDFRGGSMVDASGGRSPTRRNDMLETETKPIKEEVLLVWNVYKRLDQAVKKRQGLSANAAAQILKAVFETVRFNSSVDVRRKLGVLFGSLVYSPSERQMEKIEFTIGGSAHVGLQDVIDLFYNEDLAHVADPPQSRTPPRHDEYYSPRGKPPWNYRSITDMDEAERYNSIDDKARRAEENPEMVVDRIEYNRRTGATMRIMVERGPSEGKKSPKNEQSASPRGHKKAGSPLAGTARTTLQAIREGDEEQVTASPRDEAGSLADGIMNNTGMGMQGDISPNATRRTDGTVTTRSPPATATQFDALPAAPLSRAHKEWLRKEEESAAAFAEEQERLTGLSTHIAERKVLVLECLREVHEVEQRKGLRPAPQGLTLHELVQGGLLDETFARQVAADIAKVGVASQQVPAYAQPSPRARKGRGSEDTAAAKSSTQDGETTTQLDYDKTDVKISDFLRRLAKRQYRKVLADEFLFLLHKKRKAREVEHAQLEADLNHSVERKLGILRPIEDLQGGEQNKEVDGAQADKTDVGEDAKDETAQSSKTKLEIKQDRLALSASSIEELLQSAEEVATDENAGEEQTPVSPKISIIEPAKPAGGALFAWELGESPSKVGRLTLELDQFLQEIDQEDAQAVRAASSVEDDSKADGAFEVHDPEVPSDGGGADVPSGKEESEAQLLVHEGAAAPDEEENPDVAKEPSPVESTNERGVDLRDVADTDGEDVAFDLGAMAVANGLSSFLGVKIPEQDPLLATFESELPSETDRGVLGAPPAVAVAGDASVREGGSSAEESIGDLLRGVENDLLGGRGEDLFSAKEARAGANKADDAVIQSEVADDTKEETKEADTGVEEDTVKDASEGEQIKTEEEDAIDEASEAYSDEGFEVDSKKDGATAQEEQDGEVPESLVDAVEQLSQALEGSRASTLGAEIEEDLEGRAFEVESDTIGNSSSSGVAPAAKKRRKPTAPQPGRVEEESQTRDPADRASRTTSSKFAKNKDGRELISPLEHRAASTTSAATWLPEGIPTTGAALLLSARLDGTGHELGQGRKTFGQLLDPYDDNVPDARAKRLLQTEIIRKRERLDWLQQKMSSTQQLYEQEAHELEMLKIEKSRRALPARTRSVPAQVKLPPLQKTRPPLEKLIPSEEVNHSLLSGATHEYLASMRKEQLSGGHVGMSPTGTAQNASSLESGSRGSRQRDQKSDYQKSAGRLRDDPFQDFLDSRNKTQRRLGKRVLANEQVMFDWMRNAKEEGRYTAKLAREKSKEEMFTDHLYFSDAGQRVSKERQLIMGERVGGASVERPMRTMRKLTKILRRSAKAVGSAVVDAERSVSNSKEGKRAGRPIDESDIEARFGVQFGDAAERKKAKPLKEADVEKKQSRREEKRDAAGSELSGGT